RVFFCSRRLMTYIYRPGAYHVRNASEAQVAMPGAAAAASWWVVPGKTCVAAYQPKGAASLAASSSKLANPGTDDASATVAPAWDTANGWKFASANNGALLVLAAINSGYTVLTRWSNFVASNDWF